MHVQTTVAGSPWPLNFVWWSPILCGSPVWKLLVRLSSSWNLKVVPTFLGNLCAPGVANACKGRMNTAYSPKYSYWSQERVHARINMPKIVKFCFLTWCTLQSKNLSRKRRVTMHCVCVPYVVKHQYQEGFLHYKHQIPFVTGDRWARLLGLCRSLPDGACLESSACWVMQTADKSTFRV
jgi:hypothetical protein